MSTLTLDEYLSHLQQSLPGGVACAECEKINTYYPVRLQWRLLSGTNYSFRQTVTCDICGHTHVYTWEQSLPQRFYFDRWKQAKEEKGEKNA